MRIGNLAKLNYSSIDMMVVQMDLEKNSVFFAGSFSTSSLNRQFF